jgi:hypothetical protein
VTRYRLPLDAAIHAAHLRRAAIRARHEATLAHEHAADLLADQELLARGLGNVDRAVRQFEACARGYEHNARVFARQAEQVQEQAVHVA